MPPFATEPTRGEQGIASSTGARHLKLADSAVCDFSGIATSRMMRRALYFLFGCLLATAAWAQEQPPPDAPVRAAEPLVSPAAPAAPSMKPPEEIAEVFFNTLKEDKVDRAYELLVKGTMIEPREQELVMLRERTQKALDEYGPVTGCELVSDERVGEHLIRHTYVLLAKQLPLRWRFYFYLTGGEWKLIDLRVDDALVELFDDAERKR
jgi:hypothetical protein